MFRLKKQRRFAYVAVILLFIASLACSIQGVPATQIIIVTQLPPSTQLVPITQIVPVTQIVPATQVIPVTQVVPAPILITFEAFANQQWLNTGVLIQPGDTLTIQYLSGLWSPWPNNSYDGVGSGGDPNCDCNVMLGVSHAALIGKIGDGNPFYVGNEFTQQMGQSGYLFLGINDNRVSDNSGSIIVSIHVSR